MFKISAVFELATIEASSPDGGFNYDVAFGFDGHEAPPVNLTAEQLGWAMEFSMHPEGEPKDHEVKRASLEAALANTPRVYWPMP